MVRHQREHWDIEKLLQWAINEELPKAKYAMRPIARIMEEDVGAWRDRIAFDQAYDQLNRLAPWYLEGEPHPDAVLIAKELFRFSNCISLPNEESARALLGPLADLDPLAITAALAVRPNAASLLLRYAVLSRRPELCLDQSQPSPVYRDGDRRRPMIVYLDDGELIPANVSHWREKDRAAFYGEPRCLLSWENPTIKTIATQRAEYAIWHSMLRLLQSKLTGRLTEHEALVPSAPARPWDASVAAPNGITEAR